MSEAVVVDVDPVTTATVRDVIAMADIRDFFDTSFQTLATVIADQGADIRGPAFALYHRPPTDTVDLEIGFPTDRPIHAHATARPSQLPGGRAARLLHVGGYDALAQSWDRLREWINREGLTAGDAMWEVYVTQPSPDMNPADLHTELYWSVAD